MESKGYWDWNRVEDDGEHLRQDELESVIRMIIIQRSKRRNSITALCVWRETTENTQKRHLLSWGQSLRWKNLQQETWRGEGRHHVWRGKWEKNRKKNEMRGEMMRERVEEDVSRNDLGDERKGEIRYNQNSNERFEWSSSSPSLSVFSWASVVVSSVIECRGQERKGSEEEMRENRMKRKKIASGNEKNGMIKGLWNWS